MSKTTLFWSGFTKKAAATDGPSAFWGSGAVIGALIGRAVANKKNREWLEKDFLTIKKKSKVDAKEFFKKIKELLPKNTILLTNSELHKRVKNSKSVDVMYIYQRFRSATEGNAAAIPRKATLGPRVKSLMPEIFNKHIILSDDTIHPAALAHEAGHIIDFHETERSPLFKKVFKDVFTGAVGQETAAWEKAPGREHISEKEFQKMQEGALGSYKRRRNYPLIGAAVGGAAGLAADIIGRKMR